MVSPGVSTMKLGNLALDRWIEEVSAKGIDGKGLVEEARTLIEKHSK